MQHILKKPLMKTFSLFLEREEEVGREKREREYKKGEGRAEKGGGGSGSLGLTASSCR